MAQTMKVKTGYTKNRAGATFFRHKKMVDHLIGHIDKRTQTKPDPLLNYNTMADGSRVWTF